MNHDGDKEGVPFKPMYYRSGSHVLASAAPDPIRELIESRGRGWENNLGALGESVVEMQLKMYHEAKADVSRSSSKDSLQEQAARKIIDSLTGTPDDLHAISALPRTLAAKSIWESNRLPYTALCALKTAHQASPDTAQASKVLSQDVDEWVLNNERTLRDDKLGEWTFGLVNFAIHADMVFKNSEISPTARTLQRTSMSGYNFLDDARPKSIDIQPSFDAFKSSFNEISGGLLVGLDWRNVFVAGGIVLSSLLATKPSDTDKYTTSDIDVYIYGLRPIEANEKIRHIFEVWKRNLPAGSKTLVVRNSRTITFYSAFPIKRVQIVLKLVNTPREVLLNFDLDVCSMGYDGAALWLLPRAVRALETGYSVFTMNMIEGHYLGERRASQDSRVFKYADKGFGIRILPVYLAALAAAWTVVGTVGEDLRLGAPAPPNMASIAARATNWTRKGVERYYDHGWGQPNSYTGGKRDAHGRVEFTHAMLDERSISSSEPGGRSCLTGFELLMRHVALWQMKIRGEIAMSEEAYANGNYDGECNSYDDSPLYTWNEKFNIEGFKMTLAEYNRSEYDAFTENVRTVDNRPIKLLRHIMRISWASNIDEIFQPSLDTVLYLYVGHPFQEFANRTILETLSEHGLDSHSNPNPVQRLEKRDPTEETNLVPISWTIDAICAWQQLDRRIDEVYEILWSFYRAMNKLEAPIEDSSRRFFTEVSRRAIRPTPSDETLAFGRWVLRTPPSIGYSYGGLGQGFFGWTDSEDEEEDVFTDEDTGGSE